ASPVSDQALRIVLFGLPDAGKSALLGALMQAGQAQATQLGARLLDLSHGLSKLHGSLYEQGPTPVRQEVDFYPIALEPLADHQPLNRAVLIDCNGQTAGELLEQESLRGAGPIGREVFNADTLILAVDASGDAAHLEKTFTRFAQFLRLFQEQRSEHSEVTGLPVYIVLTKCDLLAKKTDTATTWMQRIEEAKRNVHQRFRAFMSRPAQPLPAGEREEALAFGQVELHLWATAVGRPALGDRPAKPQEPYGVAELFRQCLQSADEYRHRRQRASWQLRVVVAGTGLLVFLLAVLAAVFFAPRPDPVVTALENETRFVLPPPGASLAERLKEPLTEKRNKLKAIKDNAAFAKLDPELQKEVIDYYDEIKTYQDYNKAFFDRVL